MKRCQFLALLLTVSLCLSMLSGCGATAVSSTEPAASSAVSSTTEDTTPEATATEPVASEAVASAEEPTEAEVPEAEEDPLAESLAVAAAYFPLDETATLTAWGPLIPPVLSITDDLNDFLAYSLAEEATNIHIDWTSVSVIQATESFQLMVASADYPDLIKGAGSYMSGGVEAAVGQEVIIDLAEYLDEYAPNYQTVRLSSEEYEKGSITDSGIIGAFSYFASEVEACATKGILIRQDWLDELSLDAPVTVEDYYNVLSAFHSEYGATYGLPAGGMTFNSTFEAAYDISVPFSGGAMSTGFYQIDGTVYYGPAQEGYREYLSEMAKWYAEGLISSNFMSDSDSGSSGTISESLITNGDVGIFYGAATQYQNYAEASSDPDFEVTPLAAPVLEKGQITHTRALNGSVSPALSISTSCSDSDLENALRWCDWWYTEDGYIAANWGQEGYTFNYDDSGEPVYTDVVLNNPEMDRDTSIVLYTMSEMGDHFLSDPRRIYQYYADGILDVKLLWSEGDDSAYVIPTDISKTTEQTERLSELSSTFYSYTDEMTLRFITGSASIDDEWDSYVATLEAMGIEEAAEIYAACYELYLER